MSDPYAPPGSQRGADQQEQRRQLPPSVPHPPAPHRPAERRPPDPDGQLRTARLGLRFSLCVLAGLVATSLPLPWSLGSPAFLLVGIGFGVAALVAAARARMRWTSFVTLGAGLVLALVLLLVQAALLLFWQDTSDLQQCRDRAVTRTGLEQCQEQYEQGVQSRLPGIPSAAVQGG